MTKVFKGYCSTRTLSLEAKKEVFRIVLLRSTASEEETLKHIQLKVLTEDEARQVMRGF